jgi:hypothetical protein
MAITLTIIPSSLPLQLEQVIANEFRLICRSGKFLVEAHGGSIRYEPKVGRGNEDENL